MRKKHEILSNSLQEFILSKHICYIITVTNQLASSFPTLWLLTSMGCCSTGNSPPHWWQQSWRAVLHVEYKHSNYNYFNTDKKQLYRNALSTHEYTQQSLMIKQYIILLTIAYTKRGVQPSAWTLRWGTEIPLPLPVWGRARQLLQPSRRRTLGRSTAGGQTWAHREVGHQQWTLQWGRWRTGISVKYSCWRGFGSAYQWVTSYLWAEKLIRNAKLTGQV